MSLTTRAARLQLVSAAQAVADAFDLSLFQASILQEQVTDSGVYLLSDVSYAITQSDTKLQTIRGSRLTFFLKVLVGPGDFTGPEADMPLNMDDISDRIITEIQALNLANQGAQDKIRVAILSGGGHDYDFGVHLGVAGFEFEILYTHVG